MVKSLIKKSFALIGIDVKRLKHDDLHFEPILPPWITEPEPIEDEVIKGDWQYHALQMANRTYRPARLAYRRTGFGEDKRVKYIVYFLDLRDQRVLELGPQEGHHSIIMEKMGVRENVALEARTVNYEKCMRIKEKYALNNTSFYQQDIEKLYKGEEQPPFQGKFDLVFSCGLLYHLPDPARALKWFREQAPALFLGTHYIEKLEIGRYQPPWAKDYTYNYNDKYYNGKTCKEGGIEDVGSGVSPSSFWPYEDDLIAMIQDAGYRRISVLGKDLQNNLPHITILAD